MPSNGALLSIAQSTPQHTHTTARHSHQRPQIEVAGLRGVSAHQTCAVNRQALHDVCPAVPGTNVTYHRSSTLKRVPAVVVGPSRRDGGFWSI